MILGKHLMI